MTTTAIQGYRDLSRHLRESIEVGEYTPGARLPTEMEMSRRYRMNRHTIRAALQDLETEGYIYRVRGKGTYVARRKIPYAISPVTSFTASIEKLGLEGSRTVLDAGVIPASAEVAAHLDLRARTPVVALEILRSVEQMPACVTTSYLPQALFPDLAGRAAEMGSLYRMLREVYGVDEIRRAWSEIEAAMPDSRDRERLQMPIRMPVLISRSLVRNGDGRHIEYCVSRNRSDAYTLRVDLEKWKPTP